MISLEMPWPPAVLRPNAQQRHWRSKAPAAKSYKADCMILCRAQGLRKMDGVARLHLTLTYRPPCRRRRDLDNLLAQSKYLIDAIADTTGVDDYGYSLTILRGEPVKNGMVEVVITEG